MTRASGAAGRTAAARTADDLMAQRAARLREHEKELRRLVTDYHHAAAQARKIQTDAQMRAAKIAADTEAQITALRERADKEASEFQDAANTAVRAILRSGEPRRAVASLTQLTLTQVRAIERSQPPQQPTDPPPRKPDGQDSSPPKQGRDRP